MYNLKIGRFAVGPSVLRSSPDLIILYQTDPDLSTPFQKKIKKVFSKKGLTFTGSSDILISSKEWRLRKMTYKVRELASGRFGVYGIAFNGNEILLKTFKTQKGADNWIKRNA